MKKNALAALYEKDGTKKVLSSLISIVAGLLVGGIAVLIVGLCMAAGSGVDVRLMMPGIPDHKFAFMVAESYFGELLDHGVKIYRFTPGLLHGKTVLADREAAFVGSVNMDYRSFQLHFECGTLLYGAPALETLLEDMDGIMEKSWQVTRSDWEHRPLLHRVLGGLLRPFAMWM